MDPLYLGTPSTTLRCGKSPVFGLALRDAVEHHRLIIKTNKQTCFDKHADRKMPTFPRKPRDLFVLPPP